MVHKIWALKVWDGASLPHEITANIILGVFYYYGVSKTWVCDRSLAGVAGSIPAETWMSIISVVFCQVEVSALSWSLVQRSPTDYRVLSCSFDNEESLFHYALLRHGRRERNGVSTTNTNAGRYMLSWTKTVFINFLLKGNLNHVELMAKHER